MSEKKDKIYNKKYKKVKKLGGGSFGSVYIVKEITDNKIFAMKKFYMDNLGNGGAKRQYQLLKEFSHENIIKVIETFVEYGNEYLITEYHPYNLLDFLTKNNTLSENIIKNIVKQILIGLNYLHSKNYIHRDIKPDNILISNEGIIKITDFDLCKLLIEGQPNSKNVITLYYRPPEIFFGEVNYKKSVDIWSLGCLMTELFTGNPLFKGKNELETLGYICGIIGKPTEENWPGVSELPLYIPFEKDKNNLIDILGDKISKEGLTIIENMLSLCPNKRPSCEELLNNDYFKYDIISNEELKKKLNIF
jgi:serine/threonine protein kinase